MEQEVHGVEAARSGRIHESSVTVEVDGGAESTNPEISIIIALLFEYNVDRFEKVLEGLIVASLGRPHQQRPTAVVARIDVAFVPLVDTQTILKDASHPATQEHEKKFSVGELFLLRFRHDGHDLVDGARAQILVEHVIREEEVLLDGLVDTADVFCLQRGGEFFKIGHVFV